MESSYDKIIEMIKKLDLQDDGITMNHKIKSILQDFCNICVDETILSESMEYINTTVLADADASLKFALLFSSWNFDALAMNETRVRSKMLKILQCNFSNADLFRKTNKDRLYNSITMLGEYYYRVRLADGSPISILGESLLGLLTQEICSDAVIDYKLAKLVLSQITLNGSIMRGSHKEELSLLLFHIRRNFIEEPRLTTAVKALLLMTLDLYYSNFSNLGHMLEEMYKKYLVEEDEEAQADNVANGNTSSSTTTSETSPVKKWSEQVCEESLYESDSQNVSRQSSYCDNNQSLTDSHTSERNELPPALSENEDRKSVDSRPQHYRNNQHQQRSQWRDTRFQNDRNDRHDRPTHFSNNNRQQNRRFSGNYEDDHHSVRSDGGSIRLYSVNDRLRYTQSKMERNNWDRNSHQNFERNHRRSNSRNSNDGGNYNNRPNRTYDLPPRFQKQDQMKNKNNGDSFQQKSDNTWRNNNPESNSRSSSRNRTLPRQNKPHYDNGPNNGPRSQSPDDRNFRNFHKNHNNKPDFQRNGHRPQHSRNFGRSNRFGSQNSLASETGTGTWDRRQNRRSMRAQSNDWEDTHSLHGQPEETDDGGNIGTWEVKDNNSELVKNARNTTKFMQYLSQK